MEAGSIMRSMARLGLGGLELRVKGEGDTLKDMKVLIRQKGQV